jgi:hypothetical protein
MGGDVIGCHLNIDYQHGKMWGLNLRLQGLATPQS